MGIEAKSVWSANCDKCGQPVAAGDELYQVETKIGHAVMQGDGFGDWTQDHQSVFYYDKVCALSIYPILATDAALHVAEVAPQTAPDGTAAA